MIRKSTAVWIGSGKEGKGKLTSQSGVLAEAQYSYSSRFEEGIGTNPEELIAAAHAGCFTLKLSFILGENGFTPERLETQCKVTIESGVISNSDLEVKGTVPGITNEVWQECVKKAEENCPVSKALKIEISAKGTLV